VSARGWQRQRRSVPLKLPVLLFLACFAAGCAAERGTIGAMLGRRSDGRVFVREAPQGLAAEKAGVREGDEILLVDGIDVRQLDERRLHRALSGEVGDPVKLTLLRGESVVRVTLKRTKARRLKRGPGADSDSTLEGEGEEVTEP
jgi:C-terminal processing protease CtpA/Prc